MYDTPTVISVEEAKKEGYVIPGNYKEAVVPKLRFDVLDETLKICAENDLGYRFHTLVWHAQAVDWFFREEYTYGADITGITLWEMADSVSANGYLIPSLFYTPGQPKDVYYKVLQTYLNEGYKME